MTTSPEKIVRDFCDAWSRKNIDELMSFFDADAVYHNIPVSAVRGAETIRAAFLAFADLMDTINVEVLAIASDGNLVFTERVDRFRWQGKACIWRKARSEHLSCGLSRNLEAAGKMLELE
jgi:limonene-1,2-epoxide hydrolase